MFTEKNLKSCYENLEEAKLALNINATNWEILAEQANARKPLSSTELKLLKAAFCKVWAKEFVTRDNLSQLVPTSLIDRAIGQALSPQVRRDKSVSLCWFVD